MSDLQNNCDISKERLLDFLFSELSFEETSAIDGHMRSCGSCRSRIEALTGLFGKLRKLESHSVNASTYFQLRTKIFDTADKQSYRNRQRFYPYFQKLSLVISAAAVLMLTFIFMSSGYLNNINVPHSAMYEPWFIDSSMVTTDISETYDYDSLLNLTHDINSTNKFNPSIRLKSKASVIKADRSAAVINKSIVKSAGFDILPDFLKKNKVISLNFDNRTRLFLLKSRQMYLTG